MELQMSHKIFIGIVRVIQCSYIEKSQKRTTLSLQNIDEFAWAAIICLKFKYN